MKAHSINPRALAPMEAHKAYLLDRALKDAARELLADPRDCTDAMRTMILINRLDPADNDTLQHALATIIKATTIPPVQLGSYPQDAHRQSTRADSA